MKYYQLVTQGTYNNLEAPAYVPFEWTKVPHSVLDVPGSLFTIYTTDTYESRLVVLGKPCRLRKSSTGYSVTGEDITIYI